MFQDLRYGVWMLREHPGFPCVATLTLALLVLHFSASRSVVAQTYNVDEYIQVEMKKRQIPGLALVIIKISTERDGEVADRVLAQRLAATGWRDMTRLAGSS